MIALTFEIHTEQPLLVTRLEGDPNSSVSYRYVPGSAIRGALVARYIELAEEPPGDLADPDKGQRSLFFDGSTRYLNAYPLDRLGRRCLPTPLSWFCAKVDELEDRATVYDFALEEANIEQPKLTSKPFCRLTVPQVADSDSESEPAIVEFVSPGWQINVHTARERVKGRATGEEGAVFRYQAISPGESFGGVILAADSDDAATIKKLLKSGDVWLGRAQSAGYGRARIANVQEGSAWREVTTQHAALNPGDRVILTLLSDAIVRASDGSYAGELESSVLPLSLRAALRARPDGMYKRVMPVGGFNRKWGLPLRQVPAVEAGSVFVFDVVAPAPADLLLDLEAAGIGERRMDGFGRVAVNLHTTSPEIRVRKVKAQPEAAELEPGPLTPASEKLAQRMVDRLLRQDLDRRLAHYIQQLDLGDEPDKWPSNAQLSRLRSIALNALPEHDVARVRKFFDGLKPRSREQYERARVGGSRLLAWLEERVKKPEDIWNTLKLSDDDLPCPRIGHVRAGTTEEMAAEYTLRLVAGVLHRMARERRAAEREAKEWSHG
jgi:CRISPR-associated protein Csx10